MKGIIAVLIIISLVISAAPAFAKERNLFKIIGASFEKGLNFGPEDEIKPIPKEQVNVFQKCADGIHQGSARAKDMSLRGSRMK